MSNRHYAAGLSVRLYEAESSVRTVAERHRLDAASVVDFSLNVNPFGPPHSAVHAARVALESCHLYPDVRLPVLRRAVAMHHRVDEERVFFGAGLDDVIKLVLHAWTGEGDAVLVHLPTFPRYELEARLRGCEVVTVVNDPPWTIDRAGFEVALASRPIALAFLCTPNNPTGETFDGASIARLARAFPATILVVDEALHDPLARGVGPEVLEAPNVVLLRTFSKHYGLAGFRVGYAVGPRALIAIAELGRPPFNVGLASEAAAVAALADRAFVADCSARFRSEADDFCAKLARLPAYRLRGRHGHMLLIETPGRDAARVQDALGEHGIVVADAACFGGLDRHAAFRVSLRDRAANDRLADALELVQ